jgi:hypothetical protein
MYDVGDQIEVPTLSPPPGYTRDPPKRFGERLINVHSPSKLFLGELTRRR